MAFDVTVIGLGAMGASTAYALARRGARVVAIDPHPPSHDHGSSHGESRAFRIAYFEHPSYVPLARAALVAWRELERRTGKAILTTTGIVEAGHPGSPVVQGSLNASSLHGLPHEIFSGRTLRSRFPQFHLPPDWLAVYQPDGGFLRPERAIQLQCRLAEELGAELRIGTRASAIRPRSGAVEIDTDRGTIEAGTVVVAAGGWIGDLVPELKRHLTLTRQVAGWFHPKSPEEFTPERFPVFILETEFDAIYGFPDFAGTGVKAASHHQSGLLAHADAATQDGGVADEGRIRAVIDRHLPEAAGVLNCLRTCFYTKTLDEDFVVDVHPDDPRIVIASPCSGHGFKFASIMGEILADLAMRGETSHDISRFNLKRLLQGQSSVLKSGSS